MSKRDVLIVGATGRTGRHLIEELLQRGTRVRAVVRSRDKLLQSLRRHDRLTTIETELTQLSDVELQNHVRGCTAAASCLGHNLTLRGIFGQPRRLVTDTARRLCTALAADPARLDKPARFVLMSSAGVRHHGQNEPIPIPQHAVLALLRCLIPPHADNEQAAGYLRTGLDASLQVEWAIVRPDSLTSTQSVTAYETHPAPTRSAIFNAGKSSRINVAHFMAELLTNDQLWAKWRSRMPVIYNRA